MPGHVRHAPAFSEIIMYGNRACVIRKDKEYEDCSTGEK